MVYNQEVNKRKRSAIIAGTVAALVAAGGITAWQVSETRAEQAFIAEQYAQLEADKAAASTSEDPASTPPLYEDGAAEECKGLWYRSDEARRFWELDSVTTGPASEVSEGLYTIPVYAVGTDGQKRIESSDSCTVRYDGTEWATSL